MKTYAIFELSNLMMSFNSADEAIDAMTKLDDESGDYALIVFDRAGIAEIALVDARALPKA